MSTQHSHYDRLTRLIDRLSLRMESAAMSCPAGSELRSYALVDRFDRLAGNMEELLEMGADLTATQVRNLRNLVIRVENLPE